MIVMSATKPLSDIMPHANEPAAHVLFGKMNIKCKIDTVNKTPIFFHLRVGQVVREASVGF